MLMYDVWNSNVILPKASEFKEARAEKVTIKPFEPEADGYVFSSRSDTCQAQGKNVL